MPILSNPPFHALPHGELMARLVSLTNLKAVPDPSSATGHKLETGPFPGGKDVPRRTISRECPRCFRLRASASSSTATNGMSRLTCTSRREMEKTFAHQAVFVERWNEHFRG
jgi:hypothetical protein